jgi:ABC-type multidrug transport system ATPase subunit
MNAGISRGLMRNEFRGECTYQAESDIHFPHLTSAQTLSVAAEARAPANAVAESSRKEYAKDLRDATVAALGLSHT